MLKDLKESQQLSSLLCIKLIVMGIVVGLTVGTIDSFFGQILLFLSSLRSSFPLYFIPFLGLAGLLIVTLYHYFGGKASKGMGLIFEVGHGREDKIPLRLIPLVTATTWLTHLFGGSAGREGVAVQLGATISHYFSRFFNFTNKSRIFLVTGMAAGFAGLFQTPMAAVFFALEVLVLGSVDLIALFPAITASFVASTTSHFLGLEKFSHLISVDLSLDIRTFVKLALLGLIFGLVGNAFAVFLSYAKVKASQIIKNPFYRIFFGGLILSVIFIVLYMGRYSGLGTNLIEASFSGESIYGYDWILKLILTVLTLSIGFQGGEVTPLFAIGASLGVVLAIYFGLPIELAAAMGYISVFASATNTFLAPIFIGGEVFGFENLPYFFVVVSFAYLLNRRNSIYSLQKVLEIQEEV
jgi:H+/Cl- antiporter ClcA